MKDYPILVRELIDAAHNVVECWQDGDLASAVNELSAALDRMEDESEGSSIFDEEPGNAG